MKIHYFVASFLQRWLNSSWLSAPPSTTPAPLRGSAMTRRSWPWTVRSSPSSWAAAGTRACSSSSPPTGGSGSPCSSGFWVSFSQYLKGDGFQCVFICYFYAQDGPMYSARPRRWILGNGTTWDSAWEWQRVCTIFGIKYGSNNISDISAKWLGI